MIFLKKGFEAECCSATSLQHGSTHLGYNVALVYLMGGTGSKNSGHKIGTLGLWTPLLHVEAEIGATSSGISSSFSPLLSTCRTNPNL